MSPRPVFLESPYAGDVTEHETYARRAMADSLDRGEAPVPTHMLYTQPGVLRDGVPEERKKGMEAGFAVAGYIAFSVFYTDYGVSPGMAQGIKRAEAAGWPMEFRMIGRNK